MTNKIVFFWTRSVCIFALLLGWVGGGGAVQQHTTYNVVLGAEGGPESSFTGIRKHMLKKEIFSK